MLVLSKERERESKREREREKERDVSIHYIIRSFMSDIDQNHTFVFFSH